MQYLRVIFVTRKSESKRHLRNFYSIFNDITHSSKRLIEKRKEGDIDKDK